MRSAALRCSQYLLLRLSLDDNSRLDPGRFAHVCNVGMMAFSHQQEFILSIFITAAASFSPRTKDFNQIGESRAFPGSRAMLKDGRGGDLQLLCGGVSGVLTR